MKFIPTLALTAIGSVVVWFAVTLIQSGLHTFFEFELIPSYLFSFCMAILFYRKTDTSRKLVKSMIISIMPFILMVCFYVAFFLFIFLYEDSFPVPD